MASEIEKRQKTASERYSEMVLKEYNALSSEPLQFTPNQKRLAQHLFIKADASLKALESKRIADNKMSLTPYTWQSINLTKLAVDSIHRIEIGLDALIPNHISMIPYWNKSLQKYDFDLQIGYAGKDYYRRKLAIDAPKDIIYELVYSTDKFTPIKKGQENDVESYTFEIVNPFKRGDIVGGFGYVVYEDPTMNKLAIVTEAEFKESEQLSKAAHFWKNNPKAMRYKTIVNRVTDKIQIDPDKTSVSFFEVEQQEIEDFEKIENTEEEIIDIDMDDVKETGPEESQEGTASTEGTGTNEHTIPKGETEEQSIQEQADADQAEFHDEQTGPKKEMQPDF